MLREITEKQEWDGLLSRATIASGRFLQSWEWGEFQKSLGRQVRRLVSQDCFGQAIELPLPLGGRYWFFPKGPLARDGAALHLGEFVRELAREAKKARAIFVRFEPQDISSFNNAPAGAALKLVKSRNPACTSIIDIAKIENEILAIMHSKTRYNIRVAEKHGVVVRGEHPPEVRPQGPKLGEVSPQSRGFAPVMELFDETAKRDGFRLHPRGYYEKQVQMPGVAVFVAEHGSKLLAAAIVVFSGDTATYLHGASSNEDRNLMAPYALHWNIIKAAKERGCSRYDLWGISEDPKSGWAGITRFKRGWGGMETCAPGTFDLPISRFWYSVYRLVRRLRP
jgi:peptidoglycan pentaglycine glycine transferase (the first glycine)